MAAAQSLALRGIFDSGSQRKSWAATKKASKAQHARETISIQTLETGWLKNVALWSPQTK